MVCLARGVKDAQQDEKCCYHCSSPDHFIRDCPLVKSTRKELNLNCKEGMAKKGGLDPSRKGHSAEGTPGWDAQGIGHHSQTSFLNPDPF